MTENIVVTVSAKECPTLQEWKAAEHLKQLAASAAEILIEIKQAGSEGR